MRETKIKGDKPPPAFGQGPSLERRKQTDERAERILADSLRGRGGALTKADAIALTGLSANETDEALRTLLKGYKSHLAVTEKGELIYQFDPAMVRRDAVTLAERLRELGRLAWRAFTFLFKIWIVVTLVFYVVAFVAMLIALVFARTASDRDDRRRDDGGFGFPWILWWMMPDWAPVEVQRRRARQRPSKRFYLSVFDFVFGPKGPPQDPLAGDREVVAYLRSVDGRITATDLVALTGWSYERAEEEATRLLVDYDGEPEVNEEGTLIYTFPSLRMTAGEASRPEDGRWRWAWTRQRALPPLTGNTDGANAAIGLMNGFNLFSALAIGPAFLARYGIGGAAADLMVTWFPLAFSSLFFAIPAGRAIRRSRAARRILDESLRSHLIGEIVGRRGVPVPPEELTAAASRKAGVGADHARKLLDRLLVELDGDVTTDEAGRTLYSFPRVGEELVAAERARALAPSAEREAGQVVFSSQDEPDEGKQPELPGAETLEGLPPRRRDLH